VKEHGNRTAGRYYIHLYLRMVCEWGRRIAKVGEE